MSNGGDPLRDPAAVSDILHRAALLLRASPVRRGCVHHLPAKGRLTVAGDLHDNPLHLAKIVMHARLEASPDNHLVVQELIHGERLINNVDLSYRVVTKVAELVTRFPAQVHPLLANHELCQMQGIGVSKGHGDGTVLFRDGLDFVFGDDAQQVEEALGDFFRAMPLAVQTERGLWCSHSIPSPETTERFDHYVFGRTLEDDDYRPPRGPAYLLTWGRGQQEAQVEELAARWGVKLFCLGHATSDHGAHVVTPRMAVLNSDHAHGRIAVFNLSVDPPDAHTLVEGTVPLSALGIDP